MNFNHHSFLIPPSIINISLQLILQSISKGERDGDGILSIHHYRHSSNKKKKKLNLIPHKHENKNLCIINQKEVKDQRVDEKKNFFHTLLPIFQLSFNFNSIEMSQIMLMKIISV